MLNRRRWLIGAGALGACASLGPQAFGAEGAEVALSEERGRYIVAVGVNADRGFRFVLDTGASAHFISTELVQRLGLPSIDARNVRGFTGRSVNRVVEVDRLDIGGVDFSDARAIAWSSAALEGHDGLVGYPILAAPAVLDLAARRLRLNAPPPEGSIPIPAEVSARETLLLGGPADGEGRFVFDTGSQRCVVSRDYYRRLQGTEAFRQGLRLVAVGADGREREVGFRPPFMRFGDIVIRSPALYLPDAGASDEMFHGADALFGANMIRGYVWSFDTAGGRLLAAPRAA